MKEDLKIFNEYYENFNTEEYGAYIKYDHTLKVVDIAKEISDSLNLSEEDKDLAARCALWHDIARFNQWKEYKTFTDYYSFDHGKEGANILQTLGIKDEIILKSTYYHNKYKIDDYLDDRTKLFCNITRDADKIAIMIDHKIECSDNELLLTDDIINCFKERKQLKNEYVIENSTFHCLLRLIAFIFDINFKRSYEILKEQDIINKKFDLVLNRFDDDRVKELRDICNKYIEERISD